MDAVPRPPAWLAGAVIVKALSSASLTSRFRAVRVKVRLAVAASIRWVAGSAVTAVLSILVSFPVAGRARSS
jgi:hypothetical protein